MERLTEWRDGHGALLHGDGYTKLAQYEDTGLEPEAISSLSTNFDVATDIMARQTDYIETLKAKLKAVLPFPVGTAIWSAEPFTDGRARKGVVTVLEIAENGCYAFWASFSPEAVSGEFLVRDEGKTFFLTKEDAEKALGVIDGK